MTAVGVKHPLSEQEVSFHYIAILCLLVNDHVLSLPAKLEPRQIIENITIYPIGVRHILAYFRSMCIYAYCPLR